MSLRCRTPSRCPTSDSMIKFNPAVFFALPLLMVFLFPSCVSKKKYLLEVERKLQRDTTIQQLNSRNMSLNRELAQTNLQLAEKTGERNAFRELLDIQDQQIEELEKEIEKLTSQSLDQQSLMDGALEAKTRELKRQKQIIQSFKDELELNETKLNELAVKLAKAFAEVSEEDLKIEVKNESATIRLSENLIFRKGSTRLNSNAINILEPVASVLLGYPTLDIVVVGHTDNRPGKTDNWDLSCARATAVVKALTKEAGMAPNQVHAAGKGEFKPLASNESAEGRAANRRTEIVVIPSFDRVLEKIKKSNE